MKPLGSLISLEEAKSLVAENVLPVEGKEKIPIHEVLGRVLAEDVVSVIDIPPYNRAAMDGYAVLASDTFQATKFQPVKLECLEVVHAGQVPTREVEGGRCIQIATGAMMPGGADAVVTVEDTEREGETVMVYRPVYPGSNVSKKGGDVNQGKVILSAGDHMVPSKVGALAAVGRSHALVYRKPLVSIIPTGDEVAPVGSELKPGQIWDINSHTISSLVIENGCLPRLHEIVDDDMESLKAALNSASDSDMVVLSGGSSAGDRDILVEVLAGLGKVYFHGVQIKPGKPTIFGRVEDKPVFGMPGYPTSCLTNGYVFLVDALRMLARLPPRREQVVRVPLAKKYSAQLGRHTFLTVVIKEGQALPVFKESGTITSIAHAHGWIEVPPNVDLIEKGSPVEVHLF